MKKRVLFIGGIDRSGNPKGGESMKNKLLLERLNDCGADIKLVNTGSWKKHPLCLVQLLLSLLIYRNAAVIISASHASGKLIKILPFIPSSDNIIYWAVGGDLDARIESGEFSIHSLKKMKWVIVQGKSMVDKLNGMGLQNVKYVPNSKPICSIPLRQNNECKRFVYVSRIHPQKGIKEIFKAADNIYARFPKAGLEVDLYGPIDENFNDEFQHLLKSSPVVKYKGYLKLTEPEGYERLSSYNCFLFPTYWPGEGFPGALIDAFIAGLPIIASRWNLNGEVITDGETGVLIEPGDYVALEKSMSDFLTGVKDIKKYSDCCLIEANKYDYNKVLSKELFESLKVISQ